MLSNFEVLQVLTEQQEKQKAEQTDDIDSNVAGNLRTVQFEVRLANDRSSWPLLIWFYCRSPNI